MLNRVTLQGRLVNDPELRQSGDLTISRFTIACDRDRQPAGGAEKQADFFHCTAWRKTAEHVSSYYHKGDMILLVGRLNTNRWKDPEGRSRESFEIMVDEVWFPSSRKESGKTSTGPAPIFVDDPEDAGGELPF